MEKLREAVVRITTAEQGKPLSSSQIALIERRLHESFPAGLRMPTHPTYASMIYKAITELSEEDGSSEDSISEYMKANYEDLPWAHASFLRHYLSKLCDKGSIVLTATNGYSIPGFTPRNVLKKGTLKRKYGMKRKKSCEKEEFKVISVKKMRSGRSVFVVQKKGELLGLHSYKTEDEHVNNGPENRVVVEDKEDQEQQEKSDMFGKGGDQLEEYRNMIFKPSWPEKVKSCRNKGEPCCEQLLTEGDEERSLLDECRDKARNDILALEDDSNGNKGEFSEILVHKKKKDAIKWTDNLLVCGLAVKLPKRAERERCIRQVNKPKEQPKKLISPLDPSASSNLCEGENQQGNPTLSSQEAKSNWPSWVQSLLQTSFFGQCKVHANVLKSLCNSYCLDCNNGALCDSCLTSHGDHHVIRVRQAMYEDAIDISAIQIHIDITGIHAHKLNSTETTIVLKRMIPSWHHWAGNSACLFCKRRVPDPFYFCSLSCKFQNDQ